MSLCPHLCLLAFRALFENKRAPKRGRNANFQKSLKTPRNGVIKTLCAKDQVCKSIGVTCSTYRRFTKDKEENTRKRALKGPKIRISKNNKIVFFFSYPKEYYAKKLGSYVKNCDLWPADRHTNTQTDRGFNH